MALGCDEPGIRLLQSHENAQQGSFAGAGGTHKAVADILL